MRSAILLAAAINCAGAESAQLTPSHPSLLWNEADSWTIRVERFARPSKDDSPREPGTLDRRKAISVYHLEIKVLPEIDDGGDKCVPVCFLPSNDAPVDIGTAWRVHIRKRDGVPVRFFKEDRELSLLFLEKIGGANFITKFPEGIPLEFIPFSEPKHPAGQAYRSVFVRGMTTGRNATYLECTLRSGKEIFTKIVQHWPEGGKWWDRYERYIQGQKDLVTIRKPS